MLQPKGKGEYLVSTKREIADAKQAGDYSFSQIHDPATAHYFFIYSIGHELHTWEDSAPYYWDCHRDQPNALKQPSCIFQYTVSGEGVVEIDGKAYPQTENSCFLIERPGPYRYYLPEDSDHWEIKFIDISILALPIWNDIVQAFGRRFTLNPDDDLLLLWNKIFDRAAENKITTVFDNSLYAYRFLLTLHQQIAQIGHRAPESRSIQCCIQFIEEHYAENLSLVEISAAGGLSPFYVNKTFKAVLGDTPIHYLTKVRIKHSMQLLYNTDLSIEEIAQRCGFQNANYFAKVFRKYANMTPTAFRQQEMISIFL